MRNILISFAVLVLVWFLPEPQGVTQNGWELFAIFAGTMTAIILRAAPMGAVAIVGLCISMLFRILSFEEAFSGFSNEVVWLVVFAFFIARAFVITGLGGRLAFKIMSVVGKNSLGLGYGLVATDLVLAPMIPSFTARAGGIVYPIVKSVTDIFTGNSHDPKMGSFLSFTAFQGSVVTSAMFLTAMAGNPLILELARGQGVEFTWASWAVAAFVPGMLSLVLIPAVLYKLTPPTIRQTPHAKEMAIKHLKQMGAMKRGEWVCLGAFLLLIVLWAFGPLLGMKATVGAMTGLSVLLLSGVLKWRDILEETGAWDTFVWFGTLVTLSGYLNKSGLGTAFSGAVGTIASHFPWAVGFLLIVLIYFYSHYFFASKVAHIGTMYAPFLIAAVALGAPPALAALTLSFFSALCGGLTQYSSGPAPLFFNMSGVTVPTWWRISFLISLMNISIWLIVGGLWWKLLGLW